MRMATSLGIAATLHLAGAAALVPALDGERPALGHAVDVTPVAALVSVERAPEVTAPPTESGGGMTQPVRRAPARRVAPERPGEVGISGVSGEKGKEIDDLTHGVSEMAGGGGDRPGDGSGQEGRGIGGAPAQGGGGPGAEGGTPKVDVRGLVMAKIRSHRRYPELARRRGVQGTVGLRFSIGVDGRVAGLTVVRSAGPVLDEAAREAVLEAAPLPRMEGAIEVELDFHLREGDGI